MRTEMTVLGVFIGIVSCLGLEANELIESKSFPAHVIMIL